MNKNKIVMLLVGGLLPSLIINSSYRPSSPSPDNFSSFEESISPLPNSFSFVQKPTVVDFSTMTFEQTKAYWRSQQTGLKFSTGSATPSPATSTSKSLSPEVAPVDPREQLRADLLKKYDSAIVDYWMRPRMQLVLAGHQEAFEKAGKTKDPYFATREVVRCDEKFQQKVEQQRAKGVDELTILHRSNEIRVNIYGKVANGTLFSSLPALPVVTYIHKSRGFKTVYNPNHLS